MAQKVFSKVQYILESIVWFEATTMYVKPSYPTEIIQDASQEIPKTKTFKKQTDI